ncbi:hypothetical protein LTR10_000029 [Elasticomyces elasticus]|nr:hypothetical protein LTR10_000029 [Elasticomyces elasticus]KAK4980712.1 hypothetical protein LTR42_001021 [Elasticomyces elasticus]
METLHQHIAALRVADDDKPFRLLDLAAELRVRIYECFFEPSLHSSTRIDILDVETIKRHAPDLAILATNHLVRQEAYEIGKEAERKYYQDQGFALDILIPWNPASGTVKSFTPAMRNFMGSIASLPRFPLSKLEVRIVIEHAGRKIMWFRMAFRVISRQKVEVTAETGEGDTIGVGSHGPPEVRDNFTEGSSVKKLGVSVTRGKSLVSLDINNTTQAVLYSMGWASVKHCRLK